MTRFAATLLAAAVIVLLGGPAHAADEIAIEHVESADGKVSVLLAVDQIPDGAAADLDSLLVTVDGTEVEATAKLVEAGEIERTTVLVIDTSGSMAGEPMDDAKAAARAFIEAAPEDVRIGLLTFSPDPADAIAPTRDHAELTAAIARLDTTGDTGAYDAVIRAVELSGAKGARSVLLLSDGKDPGEGASVEDAVTTSTGQGVVVDVISLDQSAESLAVMQQLSDATGGVVIGADGTALENVFTAQADALASQVLVTFTAPELADNEVDLGIQLTADGVEYTDNALVTIALGEQGPAEPEVIRQQEPFLGESALWIGGLALGLGLAVVLGLVMLGSKQESEVQRRIAAYLGESKQAAGRGKRAAEPAPGSLKDSAVALTEGFVKGDFEDRLNQRLAGAAVKMTAAEWLLAHAGIAIAAAFVGMILRGGPALLVFGVIGGIAPWLYLRHRHKRRLAAFNSQLAETLTLLAGGLTAGLSLPQAIDSVVREGQEPVAGELGRALVEQRLGVPIEEALDGVAERMDSEDFAWVVMAIQIQREIGGNLAELLTTVANTLRERDYLRRQVRVLSAEGRMSSYILGALPILMFLYMMMVRPDSVRVFWTESLGLVMAAVAITLLLSGFWLMSKLVKVEV